MCQPGPTVLHCPAHALVSQVDKLVACVGKKDEFWVLLRLKSLGRGRGLHGFLLPWLGQWGRGGSHGSLSGLTAVSLKQGTLHLAFVCLLQPDDVALCPLTKLNVLTLLKLLQYRVVCAFGAGFQASTELLAPAGVFCVNAASL